MPRFMMVIVVLSIALLASWGAAAQTSKGAEQIKLSGGSQGSVPFPHHRHQQALNDCLGCHTFFPQESGGIAKAQTAGQLAPKQVMNSLCIQCHRDRKQAGQTTGPTGCAKCHIKE